MKTNIVLPHVSRSYHYNLTIIPGNKIAESDSQLAGDPRATIDFINRVTIAEIQIPLNVGEFFVHSTRAISCIGWRLPLLILLNTVINK